MFKDFNDRSLSRLVPDVQTGFRYVQNLTALGICWSVSFALHDESQSEFKGIITVLWSSNSHPLSFCVYPHVNYYPAIGGNPKFRRLDAKSNRKDSWINDVELIQLYLAKDVEWKLHSLAKFNAINRENATQVEPDGPEKTWLTYENGWAQSCHTSSHSWRLAYSYRSGYEPLRPLFIITTVMCAICRALL